ncbi:mycothiol conjugate amidase Mca [Granulicoccus sp. GXG6511]|uniref:mycothiol conjugate amidase Mca n=1 Tax=Granulicoccus sp. GXG6511 TaxID=3381351 RepID=UPI003D7D9AC7
MTDRPPVRTDAAGQPLRLLHVHAHPDDESSKGAATTARYVSEGVRVMVATCTGGERGSILNPAMERPDIEANLAAVRAQEMDRAREILGIEQTWLGFVDSGLPEGDPLPPLPEGCFALQDPAIAAGPLVRVLREFRPQVVTTYDENGGYPHPDHIMCHKVTMAAVEAAADPDAWPEHGPAWAVSKVYFDHTFNMARAWAMHQAVLARGDESPFAGWLVGKTEADIASAPNRVTTSVYCADHFHIRDRALLAHATQIDPDGLWFRIPLELQRRVWPTEDFELVIDRIGVPLPEDDLFAGIAADVRAVDRLGCEA